MGHMAAKSPYHSLKQRLDRFPVGAPGETTIYEILRILYTDEEAAIAAKLPLTPKSLGAIARRLKLPREDLLPKLEKMADKGLVLDIRAGDRARYMLAPTVVGFFEFSMMRERRDISQKRLAELYHRYMTEERDFMDQFKEGTQTTPFRALVHEETIPPNYTEVLDWERATEIIESAERFALGICHCRHVAHHLGKDCRVFPMEASCLTLNRVVDYVVRHGMAQEVTRGEAKALLAQAREAKMVYLCDNVQHRPTFVCNCCGCCCEVLGAFRRFNTYGATFSSSFEAAVDKTACLGCKDCKKACPVDAIDLLDDAHRVQGKRIKKRARVEPSICLGCGVCALTCKSKAMIMAPRPQRRITPSSTFARVLTMAIEQHKLHELIIDKDDGLTAHAANVLLGVILDLPPTKQLLARQALKSRFVDFLIARRTRRRRA